MTQRAASAGHRLPNWTIGLVAVLLIAIGSWLAWTKELPWATAPEIRGTFTDARTMARGTPVRVAGVDIGQVADIEPLTNPGDGADGAEGRAEGASVVTIELNDNAPPIHTDAQLKIRPRLFLEGNDFVDLTPGTPAAEEVGDGHHFPVNQTSVSVSLTEVLTTLQSDVRSDAQDLLQNLGSALIDHGGAEGLRDYFRTSPAANRFTAEVNQAFLGTRRGDLGGTIRGLQRVFRGLGRNEERLQSFITNLRIFTGSFAAEDQALGEAIDILPGVLEAADPAFTNLNAMFPALRAFSREATPGVRSSAPALRISRPFIVQLRKLLSERELRGLVRDLRPTVPQLARLAEGNIRFLTQSRALSSCFNQVVIPWSHSEVAPVGAYPHGPTGRTFEVTGYNLAGVAGENRSGDANGNMLRVLGAGGAQLVRLPPLDGTRDDAFALVPFEILGGIPRADEMVRKPAHRPDVPCETQEPPNLEAGIAAPPPQEPIPASWRGIDALRGEGADELRELADLFNRLGEVPGLRAQGADGEEQADRMVRRAQRGLDRLGIGPGVDLRRILGGDE